MPAHRHLVPPLADKGHLLLTEHELQRWGEALGKAITPPLIVTLTGELGVASSGAPSGSAQAGKLTTPPASRTIN